MKLTQMSVILEVTRCKMKLLNFRRNELITQALKGRRVTQSMKSGTRIHAITQKKASLLRREKSQVGISFKSSQGFF